jgi:hypothetical protein
MSAEQEIIKDKAYRLWQDAGSPDGRDQEFWFQAEAEVKSAKPKAAPKPKAAKAAAPAKPKAPAKAKAAPKAKTAAKV